MSEPRSEPNKLRSFSPSKVLLFMLILSATLSVVATVEKLLYSDTIMPQLVATHIIYNVKVIVAVASNICDCLCKNQPSSH